MSGVRTCWVLIFALTWLVGLANGLVAYILFGGVCVAVKTYYAVFKDNKYVRDSVLNGTPLSENDYRIGKKLSNAHTLALLDTDTGIINKHIVEETDGRVRITGVNPEDSIKFQHVVDDRGNNVRWSVFRASNLNRDLEFDFPFDYAANALSGYALSYNDIWDLRITRDFTPVMREDGGISAIRVSEAFLTVKREVRADGDPVVLFRYQLVKKGEESRKNTLDNEEIKLCGLLRHYCEVIAKLQNRAILLGMHYDTSELDDFNVLIVRSMRQHFTGVSKGSIEMPCDFGIVLHCDIDYLTGVLSHEKMHPALCFDITPSVVREMADYGTPFLIVLLRKRDEKQTAEFDEVFRKYSPNTWVRYV